MRSLGGKHLLGHGINDNNLFAVAFPTEIKGFGVGKQINVNKPVGYQPTADTVFHYVKRATSFFGCNKLAGIFSVPDANVKAFALAKSEKGFVRVFDFRNNVSFLSAKFFQFLDEFLSLAVCSRVPVNHRYNDYKYYGHVYLRFY